MSAASGHYTGAETATETGRPGMDNRLLGVLPRSARAPLRPHLERVRLGTKQVLYEPNQPIEHVYFPISGVVSLFAVMASGAAIEVTTVGNEGVVGAPVFLGAAAVHSRAMSQIDGDAWRLPVTVFLEQIRQEGPLRRLVARYIHAYVEQLSQSAACARAHSLEERCARALLLTHDRVEGDQFQLTQESLASMLSVRRATASGIMAALQGTGIVRYSRGRVTIVDLERLEKSACECYHVLKDEYERVVAVASMRR